MDREITKSDLNKLEFFADRLFNALGIDIEFTKHFLDRVNDERNVRQITLNELGKLFSKTYQKHGITISKMNKNAEAVVTDMSTDINMPFVLNYNPRLKMLELTAKTTMRKKNFFTKDKKLTVEELVGKVHQILTEEKAKSAKQILKVIGNKNLKLIKGNGYWYFEYDDGKKLYDTESVMTMRVSDLDLDSWIKIGKDFVKKIER